VTLLKNNLEKMKHKYTAAEKKHFDMEAF